MLCIRIRYHSYRTTKNIVAVVNLRLLKMDYMGLFLMYFACNCLFSSVDRHAKLVILKIYILIFYHQIVKVGYTHQSQI